MKEPVFIDINADLGEGMAWDEAMMPFISSANIACGGHAGNETTILKTAMLCKSYNVAVGVHPSFNDRENFGRTNLMLSSEEIYDLVKTQLDFFKESIEKTGVQIRHVKPHGALYNMAAKIPSIAEAIVKAVKDFDKELILFGLSGSVLIEIGKENGLKMASEVFADRTYQEDGLLTPRNSENALISEKEKSLQQVLQMVHTKSVTAVSGKTIPLQADTLCLHGDQPDAVVFAKTIFEKLKEARIVVQAIS